MLSHITSTASLIPSMGITLPVMLLVGVSSVVVRRAGKNV